MTKAAKPAVATARLRVSKDMWHYRRGARRKHAPRRQVLCAYPIDLAVGRLIANKRAILDVNNALGKAEEARVERIVNLPASSVRSTCLIAVTCPAPTPRTLVTVDHGPYHTAEA